MLVGSATPMLDSDCLLSIRDACNEFMDNSLAVYYSPTVISAVLMQVQHFLLFLLYIRSAELAKH